MIKSMTINDKNYQSVTNTCDLQNRFPLA